MRKQHLSSDVFLLVDSDDKNPAASRDAMRHLHLLQHHFSVSFVSFSLHLPQIPCSLSAITSVILWLDEPRSRCFNSEGDGDTHE